MGTAGGFSSLFDLAIPGLGSVVSAGTSLLSNVFGQADEETATSEFSDVASTATSANRPSATISKQADTITNNFYNSYEVGILTGEKQAMYELAQTVTDHQKNMLGAMA